MPDTYNILITYRPGEEKRNRLGRLFGSEAKLTFLADLPPVVREQALQDTDVVLTWNLRRELVQSELGLLKKVRLIQLLSAGADAVPFDGLRSDITIASNAGAYAEAMAEHVLAMALALSKNLVSEHQNLGRGEFNQTRLNTVLRGGICGIVGYGGIGRATARLMRALGMRIYAINSNGRAEEAADFIGTLADLRTVLSLSDVVVLSLPLTKRTRGRIGKTELDWMKHDAVLINVARAAIVDEAALYAHLVNYPRFRAGIDVWWIEPFSEGEFRTDYPFLTLPNVVGSPHNAAMAPGVTDEGTRRAVENVKQFMSNGQVKGIVQRDDYL
ncbi:MAG TPA: 2-hydroxyacid dehydrogenase [Nitrospirota bacterium]|nr:2-hydroxyacid dehydrogenase [Nitrospirota bacterium]